VEGDRLIVEEGRCGDARFLKGEWKKVKGEQAP
jgi:hypothetical protein